MPGCLFSLQFNQALEGYFLPTWWRAALSGGPDLPWPVLKQAGQEQPHWAPRLALPQPHPSDQLPVVPGSATFQGGRGGVKCQRGRGLRDQVIL